MKTDHSASVRKQLGLSVLCLAPALLFLANPNYGALDVLPDALAYGLLLVFFRRLACINCHLEEAATYIRRLLWITSARLIAWYWASTQTGDSDKPILILLFSFTFGILELIMLIPATLRVFRGFSYMAMRLDGGCFLEAPNAARLERLEKKARALEAAGRLTPQKQAKLDRAVRRLAGKTSAPQERTVTDRMERKTVVFFVLKAVLCVLPEFSALATNAAREEGAVRYDLYQFVDMFRLFAVAVCLTLGVVWLCRLFAYCRRVGKETAFFSALLAEWEKDSMQNPLRDQNRAFLQMTTLAAVAGLFTLDFYVDAKNCIPSVVGAALLLLAYAAGQKWMEKKERRAAFAVGSVTFVFSLASFIVTKLFLSYYGQDFSYVLDRNVDAYWRYVAVLALNGAEDVSFLCAVCTTVGVLRRMAARRAGNRPGGIQRRKDLIRRLVPLYPAAVLSAAAHITLLCLPTEITARVSLPFDILEGRQFTVHLSILLIEIAVQLLFAVLNFVRIREYGKELTLLVAVEDSDGK